MDDSESSIEALTWTLRVSPRARYAKLQIKPFGGLEVVIPTRFPRREVPGLVAKHAVWARQQLARQSQLRASVILPQQLSLAFDNSSTAVIYSSDPLQFNLELFDQTGQDRIVIAAESHSARIQELRAWVRKRAHQLFPGMLSEVSARTGLEYSRLSIRSQKTRWGSCSTRGNISLNDQLLFVPFDTVDYLMIHELCHTRHLNHAKSFWKLVEQHCPDYRRHEALLSDSRNLVPDWFLLDLYA